ncbi:LysR family transcriptional regulator [Nocardia sp. NPDC004582]
MDLRQLEYFLAVVDSGSVTRAAAQLRVAQPSLSQAVRKLEKDLGAPLFHRVGRGLVLSPVGEALVGPARAILRQVEQAESLVRDVAAARQGRIDIASLSDLSADPLSLWVAKFRRSHPDVRIHVEERDETADVVALVKSGACELGFLSAPMPAGTVTGEVLIDQHFVLVCPPGDDRDLPDPVPIAALSGLPLVLGERGTETRDFIENTLRAHGVEPDIAVRVQQRGAVLPIVLGGGGYSIVTLRSALVALPRGGAVRVIEPRVTREMGVIARVGPISRIATEFVAVARASVAEFADLVNRHVAAGLSLVGAAEAARDDSHRLLGG